MPDGTPPPAVADPATDYAPTARPGARAARLADYNRTMAKPFKWTY